MSSQKTPDECRGLRLLATNRHDLTEGFLDFFMRGLEALGSFVDVNTQLVELVAHLPVALAAGSFVYGHKKV